MDLTKIDLGKLQEDVKPVLASALSGIVEGAKEDIQQFAGEIGKDMLHAQLAGDDALVAQLLDQLEVLAEINRVRVEAHAWVVVKKVVSAVFSAVAAGALAVLL